MRGFCLEVSGPYACFTRPEFKGERVSYDIITPSAARAIFSAILWKPAMRWRITQVDVLNPIRFTSVRRNEITRRATPRNEQGIFIDDGNARVQRAGILLRDVRYRLHAEFDLIPPERRQRIRNPNPEFLNYADDQNDNTQGNNEGEAKYAAMFSRRADKGQCFNQPYLGCREFSCDFERIANPNEIAVPVHESLAGERDLGWMLYDLDYTDETKPRPRFFRAVMRNGTVIVPPWDGEEVVG